MWLGQKRTTGGACKVVWKKVCRDIEEGGLGIENLEHQNTSLPMKFVQKLHTVDENSWVD
jgi:hypothetical protein